MPGPLHIERMRSINFRLSHDCARIEAACGGDAWDREKIVDYLGRPHAFGKAAMNYSGDVVLGYVLYRVACGVIQIDRMLVRPESRRIGVASAMLQRLTERVGRDGIRRVIAVCGIVGADGDEIKLPYVGLDSCLAKNGFRMLCLDNSFTEYVYEG